MTIGTFNDTCKFDSSLCAALTVALLFFHPTHLFISLSLFFSPSSFVQPFASSFLDLVSEPSKDKLQLHEVLGQPEYLNHNSSNATWVSESEILYRDVDGTIFLYDIATDWKTVLASNFSLVSFISWPLFGTCFFLSPSAAFTPL